jgi:hypothetical protein
MRSTQKTELIQERVKIQAELNRIIKKLKLHKINLPPHIFNYSKEYLDFFFKVYENSVKISSFDYGSVSMVRCFLKETSSQTITVTFYLDNLVEEKIEFFFFNKTLKRSVTYLSLTKAEEAFNTISETSRVKVYFEKTFQIPNFVVNDLAPEEKLNMPFPNPYLNYEILPKSNKR